MKKIVMVLFVLIVAVFLAGCGSNRQWFDTTSEFDYAMIRLPDGKVVEGAVETWRGFDDGDQLQVRINGTTYLTHSCNVVLEARNGG